MVYSGKPSTGCYLCRRRKIKCDEGRPGCHNCEVYGKTCPGYRPPIVFQDKAHTSRKWRPLINENHNNDATEAGTSDADTPDGLALISHSQFLADASMEDRALCYFFDQYTSQRTADAVPGALESIPLLYVLCRENEVAGSPSSCLRWAVEAAALTSFANEANDQHLSLQARQKYGMALHGLQEALSKTAVEKVQDGTVAAILLLVIFEDINGERAQLESSHTAGLELVARLHTYRRLDSKYSRCLFAFAYTQLQIQILGLGARPKLNLEFLIALFDQSDPLQSLMGVVTKLSQFALEVPSLLNASEPTESTSNIKDLSLEDLVGCLFRAQSLDEELSRWCRNVPEHWLPRIVYSTMGESLITCTSVSAGALWNFYRSSRIIVQTIIDNIYTQLDGLNDAISTTYMADNNNNWTLVSSLFSSSSSSSSLSSSSPLPTASSPSVSSSHSFTPLSAASQSTPYEIVQNMIVDICRSMPFTLGDVDSSGNPLPKTDQTNGSSRVKAIEGYELLWPFWHVLTSHFSTLKQRRQAKEALYRLDKLGIKLASKLASVVDIE